MADVITVRTGPTLAHVVDQPCVDLELPLQIGAEKVWTVLFLAAFAALGCLGAELALAVAGGAAIPSGCLLLAFSLWGLASVIRDLGGRPKLILSRDGSRARERAVVACAGRTSKGSRPSAPAPDTTCHCA